MYTFGLAYVSPPILLFFPPADSDTWRSSGWVQSVNLGPPHTIQLAQNAQVCETAKAREKSARPRVGKQRLPQILRENTPSPFVFYTYFWVSWLLSTKNTL